MAVKMVNTRAVWLFSFPLWNLTFVKNITSSWEFCPSLSFVVFAVCIYLFIYFIQYGSWPIPNAWIALHNFFKPLSRLVRLNGFDQGLNFLSMTVSCSCYRSKSHFVLW